MSRAGVETVLERLIELVSIPSVSGNEAALADRIAEMCADSGAAAGVERSGRNVWARRGQGSP